VLCRRLVNSYVAANNLQSSVVVLDKSATELTGDDIDHKQVSIS